MSFKESKPVKFISDVRIMILAITAILTVLGFVSGLIQLPGRVAHAEEKIEENKGAVEKLADTVHDYIKVQKVYREEDNKRKADHDKQQMAREGLLIELIRQNTQRLNAQ